MSEQDLLLLLLLLLLLPSPCAANLHTEEVEHGPSAVPAPFSAYVGSSKDLKDLNQMRVYSSTHGKPTTTNTTTAFSA